VAQGHLDRLSSIDAGFLHQEDGGAHMHIGGLGMFEGPPPTGEQFREHIASRLSLVPRYRQKLVEMPFGTGRPVWAEDRQFRIGYHVRHTALPKPGSDAQLHTLTSRIFSQRLDRTKPLWEMWLVEGLEDGRWALICKTHHAMIDGVGGVDLLTALLDFTPQTRPVDSQPWEPQPTPGTADLLVRGAAGALSSVLDRSVRGLALAVQPRRALREVVSTAASLATALAPLVSGAPATALNVPPGSYRRVELVRHELGDYKAVKDAFSATVNDVVLAVVAGALGRFLEGRGTDVSGLELRACIPVSIRTAERASAAGNEIAIIMAPLPVGVRQPVERLSRVRRGMQELKTSRAAEGAQVISSFENALPPALLAPLSRLGFSSRMYNLLVTNVPGPQVPLYLLGRQMTDLAPLAFLAPDHTLAIAIVSYHGSVTYGLLSDAEAVPDLPDLVGHLRDSLAELVQAAGEAS